MMQFKILREWFRYPLSIAAVGLMLLLPASQITAAEEGTFTGSWIASGQRLRLIADTETTPEVF